MSNLSFVDVVEVRHGDTLASIAADHGHTDPSAIVQFPGNQGVTGTNLALTPPTQALGPEMLPGVLVPWTRDALLLFIEEAERRARFVVDNANDVMQWLQGEEEKLNRYLLHVDVVAALATFGVSSVSNTRWLANLTKLKGVPGMRDLSTLLVRLGRQRAQLAALAIPEPEPLDGGFSLFMRHAFGLVTPSWWASIPVAVIERDASIFTYGPSAITHQQAQQVRDRALREVAALEERIAAAREALDGPWHHPRVPML